MQDKLTEIEREIRKLEALSNIMTDSHEEATAHIGILLKDIVDKVISLLKQLTNQ